MKKADFNKLAQLYINDLDISERKSLQVTKDFSFDQVLSYTLDRIEQFKVVYTAFDGDHQQLRNLMRQFVISENCIPANPDSILGYKDTVAYRRDKKGVLKDDLAILRGCDELWVFTDLKPNPSNIKDLAEGVIVELLFFLKRHPKKRVKFIPISSLFSKSAKEYSLEYQFSYSETKAGLLDTQLDVLELANSNFAIDKELPSLMYCIMDPLDFKYAQWVRAETYRPDIAPLVPYLAIEVGDNGKSLSAINEIIIHWACLSKLASKVCVLEPMEPRSKSLIVGLLEKVCHFTTKGADYLTKPWYEFDIPKVRSRRSWCITKEEHGAR